MPRSSELVFSDPDDADNSSQRHPPQPLSMAYAPPHRIMVPLPTMASNKPMKLPRHPASPPIASQQRPGQPESGANPPRVPPRKVVQARSAAVKSLGGRTIPHETNATITMDTPVAWFAVNVPRNASARSRSSGGGVALGRSGGAAGGVPSVCPHTITSNDVFGGHLRGWIEPNPDNAVSFGSTFAEFCAPATDAHGAMRSPKAVAAATRRMPPKSVLLLPTVILQLCFQYLSPTVIDQSVVMVCLRFYQAVRDSKLLSRTRFEFVQPPSATSVDQSVVSTLLGALVPPWGIMRYLATRRSAPTIAECKQRKHHADSGSGADTLLNPSMRPDALVRVVVVTPPRVDASGKWPQGPASPASYVPSPTRGLRCTSGSATTSQHMQSPRGSAAYVPNAFFLSWGPSRFLTPSVPYAWVGVEFLQGFTVDVKGYAFCISDGCSAVPLSWELQGAAVSQRKAGRSQAKEDSTTLCYDSWIANSDWHVLHRVDGAPPQPSASAPSPSHHSSRSSASAPSPFEGGRQCASFQVPPHRWGPMCRLRIVQTSRNSQWGHELPISGFEVYGNLIS